MKSERRHPTPRPSNRQASGGRRSSAVRHLSRKKDVEELSSFGKIVFGCMLPATMIFKHLDETRPYYRSLTEENMRMGLVYIAVAEMAVGLCVGTVVWCVLKGIALALRKIQRPKYYPQERMRRHALARERRRIRRRTTINVAPTPDELLAQWAKIKRSPEDMIRFGSMLCDLEAYVDNSLIRNENGEIVGRKPGIRGWLNTNCQPLAAHYKTVMGYKSMAEKFRQAVGLADPYPAALALDKCQKSERNTGEKAPDGERNPMERPADDGRQNTVRKTRAAVCGQARKAAREMMAACRKSQRSVKIALAMRLSPELVPPDVEREERRRQGLPARDGLARRFVQMMA